MRKFFKPLNPSSRYSNIPYLNGSVINVGDWIRKWSSLQPRKRALIFEDRPFTYRELNLRAYQLCHLLLDRGVQKGGRVSILLYNGRPYLEIFFAAGDLARTIEEGSDFDIRISNLNLGGIHGWKPLSIRL